MRIRDEELVIGCSHREVLLCGPAVVPGGPCYGCYRRRWLAWVPAIDREQALEAAWGANSERGIHGFLPAAVTMASTSLLLDAHDGGPAGGRLRIVNLIRMEIEETRVVPVHGCTRCGLRRKPGGARFVDRLGPAITSALSSARREVGSTPVGSPSRSRTIRT